MLLVMHLVALNFYKGIMIGVFKQKRKIIENSLKMSIEFINSSFNNQHSKEVFVKPTVKPNQYR